MSDWITFDECWLKGYAHECSTNLQGHHFVSKSKTRGNGTARELSEQLILPVCRIANAELKLADTKWAQRVLAERLLVELGRAYDDPRKELASLLAEITDWPELQLDAILAGPPPPVRP